jgi:hypothetical protein
MEYPDPQMPGLLRIQNTSTVHPLQILNIHNLIRIVKRTYLVFYGNFNPRFLNKEKIIHKK